MNAIASAFGTIRDSARSGKVIFCSVLMKCFTWPSAGSPTSTKRSTISRFSCSSAIAPLAATVNLPKSALYASSVPILKSLSIASRRYSGWENGSFTSLASFSSGVFRLRTSKIPTAAQIATALGAVNSLQQIEHAQLPTGQPALDAADVPEGLAQLRKLGGPLTRRRDQTAAFAQLGRRCTDQLHRRD